MFTVHARSLGASQGTGLYASRVFLDATGRRRQRGVRCRQVFGCITWRQTFIQAGSLYRRTGRQGCKKERVSQGGRGACRQGPKRLVCLHEGPLKASPAGAKGDLYARSYGGGKLVSYRDVTGEGKGTRNGQGCQSLRRGLRGHRVLCPGLSFQSTEFRFRISWIFPVTCLQFPRLLNSVSPSLGSWIQFPIYFPS